MLRDTKDLQDYAIGATDGTIGHVKDLYFDDEAWVIRYLVVDTGSWLASRKVLISPYAIGAADQTLKILPVSITKAQVRQSPEVDTEQPVSREHEMQVLGHYGYPFYWGGAGLWGAGLYPNMMVPGYPGLESPDDDRGGASDTSSLPSREARQHDDPHLRSCRSVKGYHIQATDGDVGHVQGFLVDEETWAIRYIVVDTSNWWLGHKVLIAPQWIQAVRWNDATVSINLPRQAVQNAPPYDPAARLDRRQEADIHAHYGRSGYWSEAPARETEMSHD